MIVSNPGDLMYYGNWIANIAHECYQIKSIDPSYNLGGGYVFLGKVVMVPLILEQVLRFGL
jgi:hypothetical protein